MEKKRNGGEPSSLLKLAGEMAAAMNREQLAKILSTKLSALLFAQSVSLDYVEDEKGVPKSLSSNGEIAVPLELLEGMLVKKGVQRMRLSVIERQLGPSSWSGYWKRKKMVQVLAGTFSVGTELTVLLSVYYSGEGDHLGERGSLLNDYLPIVGSALRNILLVERLSNKPLGIESERLASAEEGLLALKKGTSSSGNRPMIIGDGPEMERVRELIAAGGPSEATILLYGETGTGKELAAEAIHAISDRRDRPLIKLNCAALPMTLIESELFGHEKGSFTGASTTRIGKFELADGGTILLDEVGEIPLETQVKLLRVLQEKELERIGGSKPIKVDVRVIAATNRPLEKEVSAGRFRSDLYYRLSVFPITLPPLRQRKKDIPLLVDLFVALYSRKAGRSAPEIAPRALKMLMEYAFPGNIRELEHIVQRTILVSAGSPLIQKFQLPEDVTGAPPESMVQPMRVVEKKHILKAIQASGGKISGPKGAAVKLGMPSTTLLSRMERLGIRKRMDHWE